MKIKTIEISGFVSCFNTLRKPFKKECRSDVLQHFYNDHEYCKEDEPIEIQYSNKAIIDRKDLKLLQALIKNGDDHSKALRLINVTAEVQAPLFWWSEMDTYEIGVVNGCSESTMHTLKNEKLSQDSFETYINTVYIESIQKEIDTNQDIMIIKGMLPSSYLQARDINLSYQTLRRICMQRANHRLLQWKLFVNWVHTLPLAEDLIFI